MAFPGDDLLALSELEAQRQHLAAQAQERVRLLLPLVALAALALAGAAIPSPSVVLRIAAGAAVAVAVVAYRLLGGAPRPRAMELVAALLVAQFLLFVAIASEQELVFVLGALLLPAASLLFRFTLGPASAVAAVAIAIGALAAFAPAALPRLGPDAERGAGGFVIVTLAQLAAVGGGVVLTGRELRRFTPRWRRDSSRERERTHLRRELQDARTIQLAMLPRAAPLLDWGQVDGVSLPATEVGGDYFDYLVLDRDRLVVVVGDVAGHGVASGLLLSGVRSCLRLLRADLERPAEVLGRLNSVVIEAMEPRLLVSLLIAVLDHAAGELRLAVAGHPPALLLRGGEPPRELGAVAPPLGTRLPALFRETAVPLATGDLLVFYSDGLLESRNLRGEIYGLERLVRDAEREGPGASPRAVRNALLGGVAAHKGDAPQEDDLTMVVARYGG